MKTLPLFHDVAGKPVLLLGGGDSADAKARLLERAGARIVRAIEPGVRLAIVALDRDAEETVTQLRAAGLLVNTVDRPDLCDFTVPAIVDRDPVLVAIGTGGVSAGLAKALRQRLELLLPASLGRVAEALYAARGSLHGVPSRRLHIDALLAPGGALDPLVDHPDPIVPIDGQAGAGRLDHINLRSADPDDLTLREARWLASADRVYHRAGVPAAILDRARADATRIACTKPPAERPAGRWVYVTP